MYFTLNTEKLISDLSICRFVIMYILKTVASFIDFLKKNTVFSIIFQYMTCISWYKMLY